MAIFLTGTYDEAFGLLVEARDYLAHGEAVDRRSLTLDDRLAANCEAMRLTSRLTQVMAWLLVQRAVHAGEMTPEEAVAEEFRLSGHSVCLVRDPKIPAALPPRLMNLLDRSYRLYTRVQRLDEMMGERIEAPPSRRSALGEGISLS